MQALPARPTMKYSLIPMNTSINSKHFLSKISGDAPRPEPINIDFIKEIENKEGNERLLNIFQQKDELAG